MKRVEEGAKAKPKAKRASRASGARKPAAKAKRTVNAGTKAKSPPKAGAKAKSGAGEAKLIKVRKREKVAVVLSGGNPRLAKADGDAPVQAYIAGMPGWKRDLGKRLDALIVRNVPNVLHRHPRRRRARRGADGEVGEAGRRVARLSRAQTLTR